MRSEEASRKNWGLRSALRNWELGRSTRKAQAEAMAVSKAYKKKQDFGETKYFRKPEAQSMVELRSGEEQEAGATVEGEAETGVLILGSWSVSSGVRQIILKVCREWYRQDLVEQTRRPALQARKGDDLRTRV